MIAQCTAHAQLKSVYGVSRVTCRQPGPPISMSKVRGPGVESNTHMRFNPSTTFELRATSLEAMLLGD